MGTFPDPSAAPVRRGYGMKFAVANFRGHPRKVLGTGMGAKLDLSRLLREDMKRRAGLDKILATKRWEALGRLESAYRTAELRRMSVKESLRIFKDLYDFGMKTADKRRLFTVDMDKIRSIMHIHKLLEPLNIETFKGRSGSSKKRTRKVRAL